ncbi:hypothetical protein P7C70_g1623, partial [Phenoliferia sp. Uapishka_3]
MISNENSGFLESLDSNALQPYTTQRKPFLPVLETEDQYHEWEMNCSIELKRTRTWEYVDPEGDSRTKPVVSTVVTGTFQLVTLADVKTWIVNNDAAVGTIRTNLSPELNRLIPKSKTATKIWDYLASELGDHSEDQAHLVHYRLVNLKLQENGDVLQFFKEFELDKNRLAAMDVDGVEKLSNWLWFPSYPFPFSFDFTFKYFSFKRDGVLYTNKGDKVDCRKCGENHTARDCPKPATDYQELSESSLRAGKKNSPEAKLKDKAKRKASSEKKKALIAEAKILMAAAAAQSESDEGEKLAYSFIVAETSTILAARAAAKGATTFICNTGYENHVTDNINLLTDQTSANVQIKGIVEGAFLVAKTKGNIVIKKPDQRPLLTLRNVLHSDKMSENIMSLQKLADKGTVIVLRQGGGQIVVSGQVTVSGSGIIPVNRKVGAFWTISDVSSSSTLQIAPSNPSSLTPSPFDALPSPKVCLAKVKKKILLKDVVDDLKLEGKIEHDLHCVCCVQFKTTKASHTGDWTRFLAKAPLPRIWLDLSGKTTPTFLGELYMLIIIDEHTRHAWIRLVKRKSDASDAFVEWDQKAERRSGHKLLEIGGDKGGEFRRGKWDKYTNKLGIDRWWSNSRTPKENPFVEREMRVTKECGKAALKHSGLPLACWGRVMQYSIWCQGRLARKSRQNSKTSYECFYNQRPSLAQAVTPGTIGWAYVNEEDRKNPNYGTVKALKCGNDLI